MRKEWPLLMETRWSRIYGNYNDHIVESRFADGTAIITLEELSKDWQHWNDEEKGDFCQSFRSARVTERVDILRFLITNGDHSLWPCIAYSIARELPQDEALPILAQWSRSYGLGKGANYFQALSVIGSIESQKLLKECYERIWQSSQITSGNDYNYMIASEALWCLQYLLQLGDDVEAYRKDYHFFKNHAFKAIRQIAVRRLGGFFE